MSWVCAGEQQVQQVLADMREDRLRDDVVVRLAVRLSVSWRLKVSVEGKGGPLELEEVVADLVLHSSSEGGQRRLDAMVIGRIEERDRQPTQPQREPVIAWLLDIDPTTSVRSAMPGRARGEICVPSQTWVS